MKLVIGIYGVSGSGKSHTLSRIKTSRMEWRCLEGSEVIEQILQEESAADEKKSLLDFRNMDEEIQNEIRRKAVQRIRAFRGVTLVAGHCSFPVTGQPLSSSKGSAERGEVRFHDVFSQDDGETYDVIFYLDKEASEIYKHRETDNHTGKRSRQDIAVEIIEQWINHEKAMLLNKCQEHDIHFEIIDNDGSEGIIIDKLVDRILKEFVEPEISQVKAESESHLRKAVRNLSPPANIYLLIDGDGTLCSQDTGREFFRYAKTQFRREAEDGGGGSDDDPLKTIFKRYPQYTFQAFWEISMLYATALTVPQYRDVSRHIGTAVVRIHEQWRSFFSDLRQSSLKATVHCIIISCSNYDVWHAALSSLGFLDGGILSIIAGNHVELHPFVVDDDAKQLVVNELRCYSPGCKVISFGDSGTYGGMRLIRWSPVHCSF